MLEEPESKSEVITTQSPCNLRRSVNRHIIKKVPVTEIAQPKAVASSPRKGLMPKTMTIDLGQIIVFRLFTLIV